MTTVTSEEPNEGEPLLHAARDQAEDLSETTVADSRTNSTPWVLATALLAAIAIGANSGYTMATNTTFIGKDLGKMQDAVLIIVLPTTIASIVPTLVPILGRNFSRRSSVMLGPVAMAAGFLANGLARGRLRLIEQVALAQSVVDFGVGLLNLLMYLIIKETWKASEGFSSRRASYVACTFVGMAAGALGGPALIKSLDGTSYIRDSPLRPWQFFFLLECMLALVLLLCIYCTISSTARNDAVSASPRSDSFESFCVALCTMCPIVLCALVTKWGIHWAFFVGAAVLEAVFSLATWKFRQRRTTDPVYSTDLVRSRKVQLLVLVRATISCMVRMMLFRLPFYAQIMLMTAPASELLNSHTVFASTGHASDGKGGSSDFKQNLVLPAYYAGQFTGEFAAAGAIWWLGYESLPLLISLIAFVLLGLLFGLGKVGSFSGSIWMLLFSTGMANGSSDNSLMTFLFATVNKANRPAAEALSSLAGNILAAAAPTFAALWFRRSLTNSMTRTYGEQGSQLAKMALENITAVYNSSFSSDQRTDTLRYARDAIEQNFLAADFVLVLGLVAAAFLFIWDDKFERVTAAEQDGPVLESD